MMLINERLINDMPCIITVRETQNGTIIGTRLMDENVADTEQAEFAKKINNNLKNNGGYHFVASIKLYYPKLGLIVIIFTWFFSRCRADIFQ